MCWSSVKHLPLHHWYPLNNAWNGTQLPAAARSSPRCAWSGEEWEFHTLQYNSRSLMWHLRPSICYGKKFQCMPIYVPYRTNKTLAGFDWNNINWISMLIKFFPQNEIAGKNILFGGIECGVKVKYKFNIYMKQVCENVIWMIFCLFLFLNINFYGIEMRITVERVSICRKHIKLFANVFKI